MGERKIRRDRPRRLFAKGDIKYVFLDLLRERPMHGYEIIRALEDRFHGHYSPSAGSVYPTLQMLDEAGYVSSTERDGKKVYTVTDKGREFLEQHGEILRGIKHNIRQWHGSMGRRDMRPITRDLRNMARAISRQAGRLDRERAEKIGEVITRAYQEIERIIDED